MILSICTLIVVCNLKPRSTPNFICLLEAAATINGKCCRTSMTGKNLSFQKWSTKLHSIIVWTHMYLNRFSYETNFEMLGGIQSITMQTENCWKKAI